MRIQESRTVCYSSRMDIQLTPDQEAFIREAISAGRFLNAEDAVREALALWEGRERGRVEILAAVDQADAALALSQGRTVTPESMREMAEDIKRQGRARLASEKPTAR